MVQAVFYYGVLYHLSQSKIMSVRTALVYTCSLKVLGNSTSKLCAVCSPVHIKELLKVCLTYNVVKIFQHRSEITSSSRVAVNALFWHHYASEQIQGKRDHFLPLQMVCC